MHVAYHRRPLVAPRDIEALALAKVGSGSIWQGYYMYAGGTQRSGLHGSEQESHATGYPNDVPRVTYDFAAPVGEHGQIRPHHHQPVASTSGCARTVTGSRRWRRPSAAGARTPTS